MNLTSPHLQHPKHLAPGKDFAPALAIYHDKAATVTVTSTQVVIVIGGGTVTVDYVGKSLEQVAAEISASSEAISCNALNVVHLLPSGYLFHDGDETPDAGKIVRMRGHVVRYQEETRIRALDPYPETRARPWYPRVDRGSIKVKRQGIDYTFAIPEYAEQEWSPIFGVPFVQASGERPKIVSQKILRVAKTPIFWYRNNISMTIDGVPFGPDKIEDVDIYNGFIKIKVPVSEANKVVIDYVYRETTLVYKEVNLNPSMQHNPGVIDHVVLLYVLPQSDSLGHTRTSTVRHSIGKTIVGAITAMPDIGEPTLVIGAYQVRPTSVIEDLKVTDTRTEGGGIREAEIPDAIKENEELRSLADVAKYDGIPFPGGAGGVMRLERATVQQVGEELVGRLVHKHLSSGGIIVLDPVVTL